jgi:hypothetical protein
MMTDAESGDEMTEVMGPWGASYELRASSRELRACGVTGERSHGLEERKAALADGFSED